MSKRFIPVLILLIIGGLFVAYGVFGNNESGPMDPKDKYQAILRNVGIVLEQGHYNPKKIDDKFSAEVLHNYIEVLDPDKIVFYEKDIKSFDQQFGNRIDDEIHGAPLKSFYFISDVYLNRLNELEALYKKALSLPMTFNGKEYIQLDGDKRKFPIDEQERFDYARKKMKYQVLSRYVDLMEARDSSKVTPRKADSTLLREAVGMVTKQVNRSFETLKNHNSSDDLFSTFVNAITMTMDPHTTYMNPVDKRTFDETLSGTFYGIGAQLKEEDGQIKVASLITGMPAWKTGEIQPNDIIMKVGQGSEPPVDVTGYALPDAVKLIRGEKKGSEVRLTLKKADGTIKVVSVLRDKIDLDDTYAKSAVIEDGNRKIGYIKLPEFYADFDNPDNRRSSTDVALEVLKLKAAAVDGIIIDLRGNGGGSLQDVVDMVGLFVKSGPVVQVKGKGEKATVLDSPEKTPLYTGPLAVMVDELSASASEIFAAAIQDYHRGIIIGSSSTYGKGTVQRNVSLDPQYQNTLFSKPAEKLGDVKLTFRKFYRIDGGTTQLRGVIPDIILPDRLEKAKIREKDTPDALGWDTIPKANYSLWKAGYNLREVISKADAEIHTNANFEGIARVVNELDKMNKSDMPLELSEFKKTLSSVQALAKQLNEFSKPKEKLDVVSLPEDIKSFGSDTAKIKAQEQFLKGISSDIYIVETASVINEAISEESVAGKKESAARVPAKMP